MNGASLSEQRDFLRELYHIKFPNAKRIVIDAQSSGTRVYLALFQETWEYKDPTQKK